MKMLEQIAQKTTLSRGQAIENLLKEKNIEYYIEGDHNELTRNIIVSYNEEKPGGRIVVGAHYDVVPGSDGYNDNASSCSVLVRLAEALKGTDKKIDFVFFDGEEHGGVGSRYYITTRYDIECYINLDVIGAGDHPLVHFHNISEKQPCFNNFANTEVLSKNDCIKINYIPFGDNYTFCNIVPTIGICGGYKEDADCFNKMKVWGAPIMKTMHCAENDNADCINYDCLDKVYGYIYNGLSA